MTQDLESLIRQHVLLGKLSPQGFHVVKCQVCNDYQTRGGFKFENGIVIYSCFNCSIKGKHDSTASDASQRYTISRHMKKILIAFGIPEDEIKKAVASSFFKPVQKSTDNPERKSLTFPTVEISLPRESHLITTDDSPWCEVARTYLTSRMIDPTSAPFYVSDEAAYLCRVIIPYFFRNKIVYWQGRSMDPSVEPRYKNPTVDKSNIFFNMDEIYRYTDDPLFVSEGPLDAISIGRTAVATLGSSLSEFQLRELKRAATRRRVIFVIDKNLNGYKLGTSILGEREPNFYITCFPDNIEDANDALQKLGKLFIAAHLATTAANEFQGKLLLEMKCSKK